MCGSPPREPKRSVIVEETIEGIRYVFDSTRRALIFKKLVNVMGEETAILTTVWCCKIRGGYCHDLGICFLNYGIYYLRKSIMMRK